MTFPKHIYVNFASIVEMEAVIKRYKELVTEIQLPNVLFEPVNEWIVRYKVTVWGEIAENVFIALKRLRRASRPSRAVVGKVRRRRTKQEIIREGLGLLDSYNPSGETNYRVTDDDIRSGRVVITNLTTVDE